MGCAEQSVQLDNVVEPTSWQSLTIDALQRPFEELSTPTPNSTYLTFSINVKNAMESERRNLESMGETVTKVMKAAMEAYPSAASWNPPTQVIPKRIDRNSKPKFVVVNGKHRTIVNFMVPKFAFGEPEFYMGDDLKVSLPVNSVDHEIAVARYAENAEIEHLFAFYPTLKINEEDIKEVNVLLCHLEFSDDEIDRLLSYEESETHLVLCVVPKESNIEDFALVNAPPKESLYDTIIVNGVIRQSLMALEWSQLRTTRSNLTTEKVVFESAASRVHWPKLM